MRSELGDFAVVAVATALEDSILLPQCINFPNFHARVGVRKLPLRWIWGHCHVEQNLIFRMTPNSPEFFGIFTLQIDFFEGLFCWHFCIDFRHKNSTKNRLKLEEGIWKRYGKVVFYESVLISLHIEIHYYGSSNSAKLRSSNVNKLPTYWFWYF